MREEGWRREKLDPAIDYGKKLGSGPINFLFSIFADDDAPVQGGHHMSDQF